ncbi:MAG: PLP-dependent aspartate aminotransferase family protein [Burkholderiaceae bacterium]
MPQATEPLNRSAPAQAGVQSPLTEARTAQGGGRVSAPWGDVTPPIYMASTYEREPDLSYASGLVYSRADNPSYLPAEAMLTELEGGAGALLFGSGLAAAVAVFQCLPTGARVVAPAVMYWGLKNWLSAFAEQRGIALDFFEHCGSDLQDADEAGTANLAKLLELPADLVWIETPANPTWEITDIAAAARLAHAAGARLVVDSTVPTPVHTRPLDLGADLVMHSATKALNGHSDVVAGALVTARDDSYWQAIRSQRSMGGAVCGPMEAWLLARGMRTLFLRVRAASRAAAQIATHFQGHSAVAQVLYPGLPSHPGHQIARCQMSEGFGAMLSLRIAGGRAAAVATAGRLQLITRATSLGSTESLVEHRASVEGDGTACPDDLLRFSIGIEPVESLIDDIEQALPKG